VQLLPESTLNQLRQFSEQNPDAAEAALKNIVAVRENLYRLFSAIAAGAVPAEAVQTTFNQNLSRALAGVFLSWNGPN
jgi:predicted RNA-binding Zn ribbon-like protein